MDQDRSVAAAGDGSGVLQRVTSVLDRSLHSGAGDRPRVTLTYAQSLDGCIAAETGTATQISNFHSQVLCHRLRDIHDAIMIGIGTVLVDNPLLTTRHVPGAHPRPVVVDSQLRTPLDANLVQRDDASLIIATTERASREKAEQLTAAGATVIRTAASKEGRVELAALLPLLRRLGLRSLMVEGGARVITSVLKARVADQLVLAIAPRFLGGVRGVQSLEQMEAAVRPRLSKTYVECVGSDIIVYGELTWSQP